MIVPVAIAALILCLLFEAAYLWIGQLEHARREAAYSEARRTRPALYDWAKECEEFGCHDREDRP